MKLFKNQKGFSELVAIVFIVGIIGSLFILGIFVWKEVEIFNTTNNVKQLVNKVVDVEEDEIIEENVKCPNDDYDWESLIIPSNYEKEINCIIDSNRTIKLIAKKSDKQKYPIYDIYLIEDEVELFIDETGLNSPGGIVRFDIELIPSKNLIQIHTMTGDAGGFAKYGWFINLDSKEIVNYSTNNGGSAQIKIGGVTYNLEYSLENGDINDYYISKFGEDIVINGILLNKKLVIKFDNSIVVKYEAMNELRPYNKPFIDIESFNSSLDTVTIKFDDEMMFDIKFLDEEKEVIDYCESDNNCVRATCCHATNVVNKNYAPDCIGVACTFDCSGPLDCGAGYPACENNKCVIGIRE